jgi:hypothetical protein
MTDWQPIATAPKDGTPVLLRCRHGGYDADYVIEGWYEMGAFDRRWYEAFGENPLNPQPTHWMPLPAPPRDTIADSDGDDGA